MKNTTYAFASIFILISLFELVYSVLGLGHILKYDDHFSK